MLVWVEERDCGVGLELETLGGGVRVCPRTLVKTEASLVRTITLGFKSWSVGIGNAEKEQ